MFVSKGFLLCIILNVGFSSCFVFKPINKTHWDDSNYLKLSNDSPIPDRFDWRAVKGVSPVKDQGNCAACWAFSIVGNIESQIKIQYHKEVILSEQFLIDCLNSNEGCKAGNNMEALSDIVSKIGGVLQEKDYFPYVAAPMQCRWNRDTSKLVPVVGFKRVRPDEEEMAKALFKHGPLTAALNAKSMESYHGGIDEPRDDVCDQKSLDHSVLIVGYDYYESKGVRVPYWIIKNSWGQSWGQSWDGQGYYYLVRGRNACGIASDVSIAYVQ